MLKENAFLSKKIEGDVLTVEILGEIDHHSARPIREEIDRLLYLYRPKEMILSLAHVSFMDSSGLGLLMGRITLAEALSCRCEECGTACGRGNGIYSFGRHLRCGSPPCYGRAKGQIPPRWA